MDAASSSTKCDGSQSRPWPVSSSRTGASTGSPLMGETHFSPSPSQNFFAGPIASVGSWRTHAPRSARSRASVFVCSSIRTSGASRPCLEAGW